MSLHVWLSVVPHPNKIVATHQLSSSPNLLRWRNPENQEGLREYGRGSFSQPQSGWARHLHGHGFLYPGWPSDPFLNHRSRSKCGWVPDRPRHCRYSINSTCLAVVKFSPHLLGPRQPITGHWPSLASPILQTKPCCKSSVLRYEAGAKS